MSGFLLAVWNTERFFVAFVRSAGESNRCSRQSWLPASSLLAFVVPSVSSLSVSLRQFHSVSFTLSVGTLPFHSVCIVVAFSFFRWLFSLVGVHFWPARRPDAKSKNVTEFVQRMRVAVCGFVAQES